MPNLCAVQSLAVTAQDMSRGNFNLTEAHLAVLWPTEAS